MNGEVWENPGEAFVGTCDIGDHFAPGLPPCDDDTYAIVLTDEGWLSVCREHALLLIAEDVEHMAGHSDASGGGL